jgi:hypothetical protein
MPKKWMRAQPAVGIHSFEYLRQANLQILSFFENAKDYYTNALWNPGTNIGVVTRPELTRAEAVLAR